MNKSTSMSTDGKVEWYVLVYTHIYYVLNMQGARRKSGFGEEGGGGDHHDN